ncbi:hypothetical protein ACOI92_05875 [Corynebacterium striatum]|uniref:hypothetical protein n=1 Tax=Corynebacterium striatum TaxID=43770 RepID=UPI003B5AAB7D
MQTRAFLAMLATAGLALGTASSCARFDPSADAKVGVAQTVTIAVNSQSTRQLVLAELYKQTLESEGRAANVASNDVLSEDTSLNEKLPLFQSSDGTSNLYIGCTGQLLNAFNPDEARKLSQRFVADEKEPSGEDFLATTHIALMNALPPELAVVEPASAHGCEGSDVELPENYVALYRKGLFNREERLAVSSLTKFLTEEEIEELVEKSEKSGSIEETVGQWMAESNAGTVMDTGGDSNSSGGSDLTSDDGKTDKSSKPKS